ncbi:MAG TPA: hypothetical protein VFZ61_24645 [Polyangiales bacterium]
MTSAAGCRRYFWLAALVGGCGLESHSLYGGDAGGSEPAKDAGPGLRPECETDDFQLPYTLDCTGLYDDIGDKKLASSVVEFTPAHPLWSDGAEKYRWISLPEGEKIDNSKADQWKFPVGTKLWKEFRVNNKRVETRIFWKAKEDTWRSGTYAWNADESQATQHFGGDITLPGGRKYHLPDDSECTDCHRGQVDNVLGFSAVNLGLKGASGVTLKSLVEDDLLTNPPSDTSLSIGADETGLDDDGVPLAAKALGILHTNCGLTCHNDHPGRKANLTSQNLRLQMAQLDGSSPNQTWNVFRTAVGVTTEGAQLGGRFVRIAPGDPDNSYALTLMKHRDPSGQGNGQMPPIASLVVDQEGVAILTKWISRLPGGPSMDAGASDAGAPDATSDTGSSVDADVDAGMDAGVDAGEIDAGMDAGVDADAADVADAAPDAEPDADAATDPDAEADADADTEASALVTP